jgi:mycothiol system anti-sigma-R factor
MTGDDGVPCMQTVKLLQEFLDRELTVTEVTTVQGHLDRCPPCLKLFRFEEGVRRLVRIHCVRECAPSSLRDEILARLKTSRRTKS